MTRSSGVFLVSDTCPPSCNCLFVHKISSKYNDAFKTKISIKLQYTFQRDITVGELCLNFFLNALMYCQCNIGCNDSLSSLKIEAILISGLSKIAEYLFTVSYSSIRVRDRTINSEI